MGGWLVRWLVGTVDDLPRRGGVSTVLVAGLLVQHGQVRQRYVTPVLLVLLLLLLHGQVTQLSHRVSENGPFVGTGSNHVLHECAHTHTLRGRGGGTLN